MICHKEIDQLLITSFCNMLINSDRIHDDLARILKVIYESHSEDIFEYDNEPWMIQFLHIKTELEIN